MALSPVGYIQEKVGFADLRAAFADSNCAAITTNDAKIAIREAIASITPHDTEKLTGVEIGQFDGRICVRAKNRPCLPIGDKLIHSTYGLPLALQIQLFSDNEDYAHHTGKQCITRIAVGKDLGIPWHMDMSRSVDIPIQHRDLSGRGIFMATSENGFELPFTQSATTAYFNEVAVRHHIAKGNLQLHMLAAGERIVFRHNLLHRSYRTLNDLSLSVPQIRAITSYHPSRA